MITVRLREAGSQVYSKGVHAVPDEHGWISIMDDDGLILGMHHKDHVIGVLIKVNGEEANKKEPAGNERRDSSGDS